MRKIGILIWFVIPTVWGCKTSSDVVKIETQTVAALTRVENKEDLEENKSKDVLVYGTIIREDFINKAGKPTGVKETLLKLSDGETVNIRNVGDKKYDYDKLENKRVGMKGNIFYGNIDSDNPEHQSRVGYRIDYTSIEEVP